MHLKIDPIWLQEQTYTSSGCCFGRIDSISECKDHGRSIWVVRGWILHQKEEVLSLQVKLKDKVYSATTRLPRLDVQAAFPSITHALRSGFSFILDDINQLQITDQISFLFAGVTFGSNVFSGNFPPFMVKDIDGEVLALTNDNKQDNKQDNTDVLILSVPLSDQKLYDAYELLVTQLSDSNLTWRVTNTNSDPIRQRKNWTEYGKHKYFVIFGMKAWEEFMINSSIHIRQSNNSKIIVISEDITCNFGYNPTFTYLQIEDIRTKNLLGIILTQTSDNQN